MNIKAIVCFCRNGGLSFQNQLPWLADKISDLEYVRTLTTMSSNDKKNILIVGRKTLETLPPSLFQSNREFYVLSRNQSTSPIPCRFFSDPKELYISIQKRFYVDRDINNIFVFGGGEVYKTFLQNKWITTFYVTRIDKDYECDTFFATELLEKSYTLRSHTETDGKCRRFEEWTRNEHPEYEYLRLLEEVYYTGERRATRNAETISKFGTALEFDVEKHGFPLLTTKKMFHKGILKELLWFIKGRTDSNELSRDGVNIWKGNTTREFLDSIGLAHYPEGCAGPIYGYQWRHFNAPYDPVAMTNKEPGVDQLMGIVEEIRKSPTSRRLVMSGWNPAQMPQMCLPPCHVLYQFYVDSGKLCCQMYQRSADLFLGLPFNIASTSLLTYIIASMTNYNVGKIRISIGDAHIYSDHSSNVLEQITRTPLAFCKLVMKNKREKLEDWQYEDFSIEGYTSHEALRAPMIA
jgi:dihydrofolate reductase/thymidylate synthase